VLRTSKRPEPVNLVHCPSCDQHEPFCYSRRHRPTPKNTLRGNPGCAVGPKTPTLVSGEPGPGCFEDRASLDPTIHAANQTQSSHAHSLTHSNQTTATCIPRCKHAQIQATKRTLIVLMILSLQGSSCFGELMSRDGQTSRPARPESCEDWFILDPPRQARLENRAGQSKLTGSIFCLSPAHSVSKRVGLTRLARKNGPKSGLSGPVNTF
jgi:hypothetical protein